MADSDRLELLLDAYREAIEAHALDLRSGMDALLHRYLALRETYEGAAADQFKDAWERTRDRFRRYEDDTGAMLVLLQERLDSLREHNRADLAG